jgi:hypothetical protein
MSHPQFLDSQNKRKTYTINSEKEVGIEMNQLVLDVGMDPSSPAKHHNPSIALSQSNYKDDRFRDMGSVG